MSKSIDILYSSPFPSTRTGALFNAFSYPTKISPEAEAFLLHAIQILVIQYLIHSEEAEQQELQQC